LWASQVFSHSNKGLGYFVNHFHYETHTLSLFDLIDSRMFDFWRCISIKEKVLWRPWSKEIVLRIATYSRMLTFMRFFILTRIDMSMEAARNSVDIRRVFCNRLLVLNLFMILCAFLNKTLSCWFRMILALRRYRRLLLRQTVWLIQLLTSYVNQW